MTTDLPLMERLKFLAIVSSNLDEFFLVRLAGLMRRRAAKVRRRDPAGMTPAEQLAAISRRVHRMVEEQAAGVREVFARLAEHGLHVWDREQWTEEHRKFLRAYFAREIQPILTPLAIEELSPGPLLPNLQLHVAALLDGRKWAARAVCRPAHGVCGPQSRPRTRRVRATIGRARGGCAGAQPVAALGGAAGGGRRSSGAGRGRDRRQPAGDVPRRRSRRHRGLPHHPRRRRGPARRRGDRRSAAGDGGSGAVAAAAGARAADDFGPVRPAAEEMAGRLAEAGRGRGLRGRRPAGSRGADGARRAGRASTS